MVGSFCGPGAFNNVLGAFALRDDFVSETARFSEDFDVERISQVATINFWCRQWICVLEGYFSPRPGCEKFCDDTKSILAISRQVAVLFWAAIAFGAEELNIWLRWCQSHGIPTGFPGCSIPYRRIC